MDNSYALEPVPLNINSLFQQNPIKYLRGTEVTTTTGGGAAIFDLKFWKVMHAL
jgi:hypothetical protein